jgi:hydrogenase nickel incorporation protein HypA/HybF
MHELSVCLSLIEEVKRVAHQNGAGTVTRIIVKVGPLSGVEPDLLQNAYPLAAAGTIAENAELEIRTNLVSGDEMVLQSLELDDIE